MTANQHGQRLPPLEAGRNFRDIGGYMTTDNREVRWGVLYRSGSLIGLTSADRAYLKLLGIRGLCDLRTTAEQVIEPCEWHQAAGMSYWSRDYETSFGELRSVLARDLPSAVAAREAMMAGYRQLPFEQAPAYREIFRRMAAGELPLIFNCSAGKDRAGTAAALILSAVGVPRQLVVEDYVMSDKVVDLRRVFLDRSKGPNTLSRVPEDVGMAVLRSDPDYINAALDAVQDERGSMAAYLREVLGVSPGLLERIRDTVLE